MTWIQTLSGKTLVNTRLVDTIAYVDAPDRFEAGSQEVIAFLTGEKDERVSLAVVPSNAEAQRVIDFLTRGIKKGKKLLSLHDFLVGGIPERAPSPHLLMMKTIPPLRRYSNHWKPLCGLQMRTISEGQNHMGRNVSAIGNYEIKKYNRCGNYWMLMRTP